MLWATDVFNELDQMRREMRAFADAAGLGEPRTAFPRVNVYENRDGYALVAEIPGVAKDKVDVRIADNILTLSGERPGPSPGKEARFLRQEREFGPFEKSYRFPVKVDAQAVQAKLENGILALRVPKAEEAKPKQITIQA